MRIPLLCVFSCLSSSLFNFGLITLLLLFSSTSVFSQSDRADNITGFPAGSLVLLASGHEKPIEQIKPEDVLAGFDPVNENFIPTIINKVTNLPGQDYSVTTLMLVQEELTASLQVNGGTVGIMLPVTGQQLLWTTTGIKDISQLLEGDKIYCYNEALYRFELFTVYASEKQEKFTGKLYQISTDQRNYIVNGVVVGNSQ